MNHIQTDVFDEALVTAIRANMCDFFGHLSRSTPEEGFENGSFTRWYTPLAHPWFNGVLCANLPEENDNAFIEETIQYFRLKGTNMFTWWLELHLKPSDWESVLSRHGFGFSDDTPGMAVDLNEIHESIQVPEGFEVHSVDDDEWLRIWSNIFIHGFGLPPD